MNINDLEDFVQLMIEENPGYKNRILNLYTLTSDKIIQNVIDGKEFSREDEINNCIKSIKKLLNA